MRRPVTDLDGALHEAVVTQFIHLFGVLVKDVSNPEQAMERFVAGLTHLANTEHAVAELLQIKNGNS